MLRIIAVHTAEAFDGGPDQVCLQHDRSVFPLIDIGSLAWGKVAWWCENRINDWWPVPPELPEPANDKHYDDYPDDDEQDVVPM